MEGTNFKPRKYRKPCNFKKTIYKEDQSNNNHKVEAFDNKKSRKVEALKQDEEKKINQRRLKHIQK